MTPAQISRTPGQDGRSAELRDAARRLGAGVGRRRFLTVTGAAAALAFATGLPGAGTAAAAELDARRITEDPFTLGVASGDPLPTSVLLWTRLASRPFEPDGGLPADRVEVRWEIARDGDRVVIETAATVYVYEVTSRDIVRPRDVEVIAPVPGEPGEAPAEAVLTVTSCHPKYAATQRFVVHGRLAETIPRAAWDPGAWLTTSSEA